LPPMLQRLAHTQPRTSVSTSEIKYTRALIGLSARDSNPVIGRIAQRGTGRNTTNPSGTFPGSLRTRVLGNHGPELPNLGRRSLVGCAQRYGTVMEMVCRSVVSGFHC